jgi:hypothetical protein
VTRAIILAAGRGERLRPLTDQLPKPLLRVRHRPLIEWHLHALSRAGVREVVINTAWLEARFPAALGDGRRFRLTIHYSTEGRDHGGALETAGGIAKALPLLGESFWVVAGDVFVPGFEFDAATAQRFAAGHDLGHLWLVPNPPTSPSSAPAPWGWRWRCTPPARCRTRASRCSTPAPAGRDVADDPRTLALSLGSVQLLQRLQAWPAEAAQPITAVHVSQAPPSPALLGTPRCRLDAAARRCRCSARC